MTQLWQSCVQCACRLDMLLNTSAYDMQGLLKKPQALYAMVLSPTRELAIQIAEQFEALGSGIGVKCAVLVGGIDMMAQAIALGKRPHVIVGTPGRVVDHLSNTKVQCFLDTKDTCYKGILPVRTMLLGTKRCNLTAMVLWDTEYLMQGQLLWEGPHVSCQKSIAGQYVYACI